MSKNYISIHFDRKKNGRKISIFYILVIFQVDYVDCLASLDALNVIEPYVFKNTENVSKSAEPKFPYWNSCTEIPVQKFPDRDSRIEIPEQRFPFGTGISVREFPYWNSGTGVSVL